MAKNIEIKAQLNNQFKVSENLIKKVEGVIFHKKFYQKDYFFQCSNGRIKLRQFADSSSELIFYQRSDDTHPTESYYEKSPVSDPSSLLSLMNIAYGSLGVVEKERTLYKINRTRVHLDQVKGLGDFIELEVEMSDDECNETGISIANKLLNKLNIHNDQLVKTAYIDMLKLQNKT